MKPRLPLLLLVGVLAAGLVACGQPAPEPTPTPTPTPATAKVGERVTDNGWALAVAASELEATAAVAAANEFNPAPGEDEQYATVTVTLERTASTATALDVSITLTVAGEEILPAPAVAPGQLHLLDQFAPGVPVTGSLAFLVPTGTKAATIHVVLDDGPGFIIGSR